MATAPPREWIPLAGVLLLAVAGLGWGLLGARGPSAERQLLPGNGDVTVEILRGATVAEGIAEIAARPDADWTRCERPELVPVGPGRVRWVRMTVRNPRARDRTGVLVDAEDYADRADFFQWRTTGPSAGEWHRLHSGENFPATGRALWGHDTAFPVAVPAGGKARVYLRYEDFFAVWLEWEWWPEGTAYAASSQRTLLVDGGYFGTLLALLFYNAVLWAWMRLRGMGAYLGYLGAFLGFMLLARGAFPLLGGALGSPWREAVMLALLALSGAMLAAFARGLLELRERLPRWDRGVGVLQWAMLAVAGVALAAPPLGLAGGLQFVPLASAGLHVALAAVAVASWRAGVRQARVFGLAFGVLLAGLLPVAAVWAKWLSLEQAGLAAMFGSALEALLLSLAVADRMAEMQRQTIAAQAALLAEVEQREAMQEAYADELATEIDERTRDLAAANADKDRILAVLGHDLRSPLTGLTQSAELLAASPDPNADPGLDPARQRRFVADAARTGRELLLLIEDLVLWARLRAGAVHVGDHAARALVEPAATLYQSLAEQTAVALTVDVPADLRTTTDLVLTRTLVRNLLANALRHARARVAVTARLVGGDLRLTIRDDGPGLPEAEQARLFAASTGRGRPLPAEGGLGLWLCAEIARSLGARLEVNAAPDRGTEFAFSLPTPKTPPAS